VHGGKIELHAMKYALECCCVEKSGEIIASVGKNYSFWAGSHLK
jgi:hypothetical protein